MIDGETLLVFCRLKKDNKSLLTIEIKDGAICQVHGVRNRRPSAEEIVFIEKYAKKKGLEFNNR